MARVRVSDERWKYDQRDAGHGQIERTAGRDMSPSRRLRRNSPKYGGNSTVRKRKLELRG